MSSPFIACKSFVLSSSRSSFAAPFPLQHGPVQIKRRRGAAGRSKISLTGIGGARALRLHRLAWVRMSRCRSVRGCDPLPQRDRTNSQNSCPDAARTGLVKSWRLREPAFEGECHKQKEACHDRRRDHYSDHPLSIPLEDESIRLGCTSATASTGSIKLSSSSPRPGTLTSLETDHRRRRSLSAGLKRSTPAVPVSQASRS